MPLVEYYCKHCEHIAEEIVKHPIPSTRKCDRCGEISEKQISYFGGYTMKGDNGASITPKKFRGNKER